MGRAAWITGEGVGGGGQKLAQATVTASAPMPLHPDADLAAPPDPTAVSRPDPAAVASVLVAADTFPPPMAPLPRRFLPSPRRPSPDPAWGGARRR